MSGTLITRLNHPLATRARGAGLVPRHGCRAARPADGSAEISPDDQSGRPPNPSCRVQRRPLIHRFVARSFIWVAMLLMVPGFLAIDTTTVVAQGLGVNGISGKRLRVQPR